MGHDIFEVFEHVLSGCSHGAGNSLFGAGNVVRDTAIIPYA